MTKLKYPKAAISLFLFPLLSLFPHLSKGQIDLWKPSDSLKTFVVGIVSTGMNERDIAISPDGKEMFYTVALANSTFTSLVCRRIQHGKISEPIPLNFTGRYSDLEPAFSNDGKKLYFVSNRPLDQKSSALKDFDIWFVERTGTGWSEPKNLGAPINTGADEFYPSLTKNGTLYFTAGYNSGKGGEDIFYSNFENGEFSQPVSLSDSINTLADEFNAFISSNEDFIIFSTVRKGDMGRGDLYVSIKNSNGIWTKAKNMGSLVNSTRLDYCPYVSPDGKTLFITSERITVPRYHLRKQNFDQLKRLSTSPGNAGGDIYYMSLEAALKNLKK